MREYRPICRNCKNVRNPYGLGENYWCGCEKNDSDQTDLVTGIPIQKFKNCYVCRSANGGCGPDGLWYVAAYPEKNIAAKPQEPGKKRLSQIGLADL